MKEVGHQYFSKINQVVNSESYNEPTKKSYSDVMHIANFSDKNAQDLIFAKLQTQGFLLADLNQQDNTNIENIAAGLTSVFGAPYCDKNPGKLRHAKVQAEQSAKFYINSHFSQPVHTDQGHTTVYPRYVALYCSQPACFGGESIAVPFKPLFLKLLQQFGRMVDELFYEDAVIIKNWRGIEKKPILLQLENDEIGISYSPVLQKMWCYPMVFELYDFITQYVHDQNNQIRFQLQKNQILLLDNSRVLHGRTAFSSDSERLLYRYWFQERALLSPVC